jgi:hypothetical protein
MPLEEMTSNGCSVGQNWLAHNSPVILKVEPCAATVTPEIHAHIRTFLTFRSHTADLAFEHVSRAAIVTFVNCERGRAPWTSNSDGACWAPESTFLASSLEKHQRNQHGHKDGYSSDPSWPTVFRPRLLFNHATKNG